MKNNRLGCFSATGITAALVAVLAVAGLAFTGGNALFSPGALNAEAGKALNGVTSHAGIQDCAACHTPPFSPVLMADRCLECHTALVGEMRDLSSLHGAIMLASGQTNCLACHTEHHGKDASLISLSMQDFPHEKLGFSLASHSERQDGSRFVCADCHPDSFSAYTCDTCHRQMDATFMDDHIAAVGTDCVACHDGLETLGANFDHARTRFPLTGGHLNLLCVSCHTNARTLNDLQSTPTDCANCHAKDEPHGGRFGTDCASCHTSDAWAPAKFDHDLARFKLTGEHIGVACENCHKNHVLAGTPMDCQSCHLDQDPHGDVFGTDCAACHTTNGWGEVTYDHAQTGFVLNGAHATLTCKQCHGSTPASQMSSSCGACHAKDDKHGGSLGMNCGACHSTTAWKPSTFNHALSNFPLTGAHASVACASCHKNGQFAGTSTSCYSCHAQDDNHGGRFGKDCGACHSTSTWKGATFDHSLSGFALTGAHASVACSSCHQNGQFSGTSSACASCHGEPAYHRGVFGTNCGSCHSTSNWSATYNGSHPRIDERDGRNHHGASCHDCHTQSLGSATCTKCHDSNNPGDGGEGGGGGDDGG
jgi:hypothetical protein